MDDRTMLELAARAAGIEWDSHLKVWIGDCRYDWNPLTGDGDALRLAVKLGLEIAIDVHQTCACSFAAPIGSGMFEQHGSCPYAATRRAIVRAAAAIGKEKA